MGGWADDGKTYYIGQRFRGVGGILPIIDVTNPYNAKWLLNWTFTGDGRPHDVNTNNDGTRLYAAQPGNFGAPPNNSSFGPDGLVILDVSDIQFRIPNPQIRIISRLFWDDQGQAEQMLPFFSHGRSYLISTDESGGQAGVGRLAAACARRASPYGYSNVIAITDETNPRIVSKIMLEVHDPKNCTKFLAEPPEVGGGPLDYSTERCAVDRPINPTMAACGSRGTGTRVFDIRDPLHPAEIAYWKGPAPRTAFLPGSGSWSTGVDRTVEKQAGLARFVKVPAANGKGPELNLWIVGDAGGFQVLRFADSYFAKAPGKAVIPEGGGARGQHDGDFLVLAQRRRLEAQIVAVGLRQFSHFGAPQIDVEGASLGLAPFGDFLVGESALFGREFGIGQRLEPVAAGIELGCSGRDHCGADDGAHDAGAQKLCQHV